MEFLRQHQLNIMLAMSSICFVVAFFVCITNTLSHKRRISLLLLEFCAALLLVFDRFAYIYRGNVTTLGWYMVRICNFAVFFLSLFILYAFNNYLADLLLNEGKLKKVPYRIRFTNYCSCIGFALIVISQFTGFYYTFDEMNRYQRAPGFLLCYTIPLIIMLTQFSLIIQYYKRITRIVAIPTLLFTILPLAASIVQIFFYGLSLTNMTLVFEAVVLYVFVLLNLNKTVAETTEREMNLLKEEQKNMRILFEQTAEALSSAIDAKDRYTHGHSARVAEYSRRIATQAGFSEKECDEVYFAALLHDVGKIGIPGRIINKSSKLTEEEYNTIKAHPVIGEQILSRIHQSPYLAVGAHYHHERYDGNGYPDGLQGDEIPVIARIIAVADSYDAMSSKRSYRESLPQAVVRSEIQNGCGSQFDPHFAQIMLQMIDNDPDYTMREK